MDLEWLVDYASIIRSGVREVTDFTEEQGSDSDPDWIRHRQPKWQA